MNDFHFSKLENQSSEDAPKVCHSIKCYDLPSNVYVRMFM